MVTQVRKSVAAFRLRAVRGQQPGAAADVADGRGRVAGPLGHRRDRDLARGGLEGALEQRAAEPGRAGHHEDLAGLVLVEVGAEHAAHATCVLFLISVSSSEAIRVQFALVVFTVTALGPVIWLAPHLLAHM